MILVFDFRLPFRVLMWYVIPCTVELSTSLHSIAYQKTVNLIFWLYAFYGFHSFLSSHLQPSYPVVKYQASTTALLTNEEACTSSIPVLCVISIPLYNYYCWSGTVNTVECLMFKNSASCLSPTHALNQTDILPHFSSFISLTQWIICKSTCLHKSWC